MCSFIYIDVKTLVNNGKMTKPCLAKVKRGPGSLEPFKLETLLNSSDTCNKHIWTVLSREKHKISGFS